MGYVAQAVQEFDESVRAPWRPRLVSVPEPAETVPLHEAVARPQPSRRNPSRVGACRPPAAPARTAPRAHPARSRAHGHGGRGTGADLPSARPAPRRSAVAARRPGGPRLRPTRRARRLAVGLALAAGVAVGSWLGPILSGGDGGGEGLRLAGASVVVVEPGDTLWSIAGSVAGSDDVRAVVDRIQQLNDLEGAELVPGQTLLLP